MAEEVLESQLHMRGDCLVSVGNGREDLEVAVHEVVIMVVEGLLARWEDVDWCLLELLDVQGLVHSYYPAEQIEPFLIVIMRDGHIEEIYWEVGFDGPIVQEIACYLADFFFWVETAVDDGLQINCSLRELQHQQGLKIDDVSGIEGDDGLLCEEGSRREDGDGRLIETGIFDAGFGEVADVDETTKDPQTD